MRPAVFFAVILVGALGTAAAVASDEPVYPEGADVPPLGEAVVENFVPQARMINEDTCELIAAIRGPEGHIMREGEGELLLYRQHRRSGFGRSTPAFARGEPRSDGLVVVFFKARPNELITGRAMARTHGATDSVSAPVQVGPPIRTTCRSGHSSLGSPTRIP